MTVHPPRCECGQTMTATPQSDLTVLLVCRACRRARVQGPLLEAARRTPMPYRTLALFAVVAWLVLAYLLAGELERRRPQPTSPAECFGDVGAPQCLSDPLP